MGDSPAYRDPHHNWIYRDSRFRPGYYDNLYGRYGRGYGAGYGVGFGWSAYDDVLYTSLDPTFTTRASTGTLFRRVTRPAVAFLQRWFFHVRARWWPAMVCDSGWWHLAPRLKCPATVTQRPVHFDR